MLFRVLIRRMTFRYFLRATEAIGVKREVISTALAYVGPTIVVFCNKQSSILYPEKASKESWGRGFSEYPGWKKKASFNTAFVCSILTVRRIRMNVQFRKKEKIRL